MLKITKNGRTIPLDRLADEMIKDVRSAAAKQIRQDLLRRLRSVRCGEHGIAIRDVRVAMDRNDQATVSVDTCCNAVQPAVDAIIGKR